jgi:hypothetical protein
LTDSSPLLDAHLVSEDTQPRLAHTHDAQLVADARLVLGARVDLFQLAGNLSAYNNDEVLLPVIGLEERRHDLESDRRGRWTYASQPETLGDDQEVVLLRPAYFADNSLVEREVGDVPSLASRHGQWLQE